MLDRPVSAKNKSVDIILSFQVRDPVGKHGKDRELVDPQQTRRKVGHNTESKSSRTWIGSSLSSLLSFLIFMLCCLHGVSSAILDVESNSPSPSFSFDCLGPVESALSPPACLAMGRGARRDVTLLGYPVPGTLCPLGGPESVQKMDDFSFRKWTVVIHTYGAKFLEKVDARAAVLRPPTRPSTKTYAQEVLRGAPGIRFRARPQDVSVSSEIEKAGLRETGVARAPIDMDAYVHVGRNSPYELVDPEVGKDYDDFNVHVSRIHDGSCGFMQRESS